MYEIKESELEIFQKGSPADLHLNFAIFLFSIGFGAIASLATATVKSDRIQTTFIVIAVVGIILGVFFSISWWRNRTPLSLVCETVRQRIKETEAIVSSESKLEIPPVEPNEPKDRSKL